MKTKVKLAIHIEGIRSTQKQNVSAVILEGKEDTGSGCRKSSPSNQFYGSDTLPVMRTVRGLFLKQKPGFSTPGDLQSVEQSPEYLFKKKKNKNNKISLVSLTGWGKNNQFR